MLLEKTIYVMPTVHTEPTAWRGADDSEQVDNTMAFSLLVAAAAEAAFGSPISTDLDLATPSSRDRAHTHRVKLSFPFSLRLHIAPLLSSETSSLSGILLNNHLTHSITVTITIYYQISKLVVYLSR